MSEAILITVANLRWRTHDLYLFDGNGDWGATHKANPASPMEAIDSRSPATTTAGRQRIQSYLADDSVSGHDQMTGAQAPTSSPGRMLRLGQFLSGPHQG
jgi:hypothetical protein